MQSVSAKIPVPLGPRAVAPPPIREHRIPTPGSKPYIAVEGRDGCLWFCESGTSKIGRLDPKTYAFKEFDLPSANATPIGIVVGPEGDLWFAEKSAGKIGRITMQGKITEFALPTPNAGPDAMMLGPDGNIWFSETEVSQIGRRVGHGDRTRTQIDGRDFRQHRREILLLLLDLANGGGDLGGRENRGSICA